VSFAVALIAAAATVNPLRLWSGLPGRDREERLRLTALGAGLVVLVLVVLAALSRLLLDGLDISDPTARIAAGVAIVVTGVRDAFASPARVEPALPGPMAALVPVALPHLLGPGITLLTLSIAADRGVGEAALVVALANGLVVLSSTWPAPTGAAARAARAGQVMTSGLALALGASLMLDGVLDI
jgi:small neutral amino acid transporter SnatA (MarC family)